MLTRLFSKADDGLLTATIVTGAAALSLAAFYFILRLGFYNPLMPVLGTAGLALILLSTPATIELMQRRFSARGWLYAHSAHLLMGLVAMCLLGLVLAILPIRVPMVLVVIGFGIFIVHFMRWIRQRHLVAVLFYVGLGVFIGLWIGGVHWSGNYFNYYSPLYLEKISVGQYPLITDTLYHASINAIFQTFGVPSTGLNGIPYHAYHYGSHWMFAQFARLLELGSLEFYQLGFPVVFGPLFLFSILVAVIDIGKAYKLRFGGSTPAAPMFWLVLVMVIMGYVTDSHFYLLSGSYVVGLSLLILTLGIVAKAVSTQEGMTALAVLIPVMIAAMGITKISIGVIAVALSFYFFLRWRLFRQRRFVVGMIAALVIIVGLYRITVNSDLEGLAVNSPINLLIRQLPNAFGDYVAPLFLPLIFIILRLVQKRVRSVGEFWEQVSTNQLIDVEVVAVTAIASIGPGLAGLNDTYYFTNVQRWIALVFVLVFSTRFLPMLRVIPAGMPRKLRFVSLRNLFLIVLFSLWVIRIGYYAVAPIREARSQGITIRYYYAPGLSTLTIIRAALNQDADVVYAAQHEASKNATYQFLSALADLRNLQEDQKRETLVFIPRSNELYWGLEFHHCFGPSFVAPALTEMAMLDGLPADPACDSAGFGLPDYDDDEDRLALTPDEPDKLCEAAQSLGFKQVLVVDMDESNEVVTTSLNCETP